MVYSFHRYLEENMREKYESLALVDLKAVAKARGLRGISTMKGYVFVGDKLVSEAEFMAQITKNK